MFVKENPDRKDIGWNVTYIKDVPPRRNLSEAAVAQSELIKYGCNLLKGYIGPCNCLKAELPWTELCI